MGFERSGIQYLSTQILSKSSKYWFKNSTSGGTLKNVNHLIAKWLTFFLFFSLSFGGFILNELVSAGIFLIQRRGITIFT